jgi:outer membrane protein
MRYSKANMDLGDALYFRNQAFMVLASLIGKEDEGTFSYSGQPDQAPLFHFTTSPDQPAEFKNPDEQSMIESALLHRPETRLSAAGVKLAEHSRRMAEAGLYPSVQLTGNYTFADPNQRVGFQTDPWKFTGTWAVGILITYDIGGLPGVISAREAQTCTLLQSKADEEKQKKAVTRDVRSCLMTLARVQRDLRLTTGMVSQAEENLRVISQKYDLGVSGESDLLSAQLGLLQSHSTVMNKQIDVQIAEADLYRATASGKLD